MFFVSSRRRHTRFDCDWSSDVCSSDLDERDDAGRRVRGQGQVPRRPAGARRRVQVPGAHQVRAVALERTHGCCEVIVGGPSPSLFPLPRQISRSMNGPVVALDRVTKRFAGHTAVDGLSLAVPRGGIFGLLGPNGAGKTTSIRMIMDILEPDEGEVRLFGERGAGRDHSARIGYLPEERGLYPKMRVLDVLVFLAEVK